MRIGEVIDWLEKNAKDGDDIPGVQFIKDGGQYDSSWKVKDIQKFEEWLSIAYEYKFSDLQEKSNINALVDAVWQVLDDMSTGGLCVCGAAKAELRVAFEPFRGDMHVDFSLEEAKDILKNL